MFGLQNFLFSLPLKTRGENTNRPDGEQTEAEYSSQWEGYCSCPRSFSQKTHIYKSRYAHYVNVLYSNRASDSTSAGLLYSEMNQGCLSKCRSSLIVNAHLEEVLDPLGRLYNNGPLGTDAQEAPSPLLPRYADFVVVLSCFFFPVF